MGDEATLDKALEGNVVEYEEIGGDLGDQDADTITEIINIVSLAAHEEQCPEDEKAMVRAVVQRCTNSTRRGDFASVDIIYYRKMGIAGRRYGRGPCAQKLSRVGRRQAFFKEVDSSFDEDYIFVDVDINNCFPALMCQRLR